MPRPLSFLQGWWAGLQRRQGRYSRAVLGAGFVAWRHGLGGPKSLLAWLQLRRDWGLPMRQTLAKRLWRVLPDLGPRQRSMAMALLAEHALAHQSLDRLLALPLPWRQHLARQRPALASVVLPELIGPGLGESTGLAQLAAQQPVWRADFARVVLAARAVQGLAVVGNAAHARGQGWGEQVDGCACVLRFNHYARGAAWQHDVGRQVHVWVVAPGYDGPLPDGPVNWVVVTGPAMDFKLKNWAVVQPLLNQGVPVLTVPLSVWRSAVQQLDAPPSGGFLLLAWLQQMLGGTLQGVHVMAMGMPQGLPNEPAKAAVYHAASSHHKRSARHNWSAESQWLEANKAGWL